MGPKKNEPSKKTEMKKKEKIIEDKTFGMKNKKGAKQQKFIQQVQQQVTMGGKTAKQLEKEKADKLSKKEEKKKEVEELNAIFKPVEQKISKGVDPKSVLCAFFKAGQCTKGDKCKFSHDMNIGRKSEKRSMYDDQRETNDDTMDTWDESKLADVINKKHGESNMNKPKTDIICKYFLDALENNKYGWFWECPNGELCHYRHALPPGFVLKKDQKKANPEDMISLEDLIERERAALSSQNLTKVTFESFLHWKERKRREKLAKLQEDSEKKKANYSAGRLVGISGREMFDFNPDLITGDDDDADDDVYQREINDEDDEAYAVREVNLDMFIEENQEYIEAPSGMRSNGLSNHTNADDASAESRRLSEAAALPSAADYDDDGYAAAGGVDDDDIDENLFDEEGLDQVEEELETLELN